MDAGLRGHQFVENCSDKEQISSLENQLSEFIFLWDAEFKIRGVYVSSDYIGDSQHGFPVNLVSTFDGGSILKRFGLLQQLHHLPAFRDRSDFGLLLRFTAKAFGEEFLHEGLLQFGGGVDEPIPMLDNKTPRQCAKSKTGREQVVEWLKYLENNELRRAAGQGQAPYDSSWMWEELKLAKYRNC